MKIRKLRSACDVCHKARVKCTGGQPCSRCSRSPERCLYSYSQRNGRLRAPSSCSMAPSTVSEVSQPVTANDKLAAPVNTCADLPELPDISVDLFDTAWPDFGNRALELTSDDFYMQDVPRELPIPSDVPSVDCPDDPTSTKDLCNCRTHTLKCLSLLDGNGAVTTRLDTIIAKANDVFQHVGSFKSCNVCTRFIVQTTLTIYLLQHVADHFCNVARNPQAFFAGVPQLRLGSLSLSHEQDTRHKRDIVLATLDTFRQVVQGVVTTTKNIPILKKEKIGMSTPPQPTAVMNARFLLMSAQHLQKRVQLIKDVFQSATTAL